MKTLKVLLQEVVSGIKAWVNSNFAQESNTVHKTGNETVNGIKMFTENVFQNQAGGVNVYCATCDGAVKGDLTSSGTLSIVCKDGSSANMETSGLAAVYMGQDTSGSYVALRADTTYNNTRYNASVSLDIDPTTANNNAIFRPRRDNTIDLGSSSYQFKNLYAKNYYYNGTAWGLDKENTWTKTQHLNGDCAWYYDRGDISLGTLPGTTRYYNTHRARTTQTGKPSFSVWRGSIDTSGTNYYQWTLYNLSDGTLNCGTSLSISNDGSFSEYTIRANTVTPSLNTTNLGTSTNKWKSFNGLNPGDLSLPDYDSNAKLEFTSEFPTPDSSGNIRYTPTMNGWLYVYFDVSSATINSGNVLVATIKDANMANANCAQMFWRSQPASDLLVFFPVVANKQFIIQINFTGYTLKKALLIPGMGYVA